MVPFPGSCATDGVPLVGRTGYGTAPWSTQPVQGGELERGFRDPMHRQYTWHDDDGDADFDLLEALELFEAENSDDEDAGEGGAAEQDEEEDEEEEQEDAEYELPVTGNREYYRQLGVYGLCL